MNEAKPKPKPKKKRGWLRRWTGRGFTLALVLTLTLVVLLTALDLGLFDGWMRDAVVRRIEQVTGGKVELTHFHFSPFALRVELMGLTIHGREPAGVPPLFHADMVAAAIRVDSFWRKKISLNDLHISRPDVDVRFGADSSSNLPALRTAQTNPRPFRERIFEFTIRHIEIDDGTILYNNVRTPLTAAGNNFALALDWGVAHDAPLYLGQLSWQQFTLTAKHYMPFAVDLSMRFSFAADSFHVAQCVIKLPHSSFDVQGDVENLAAPAIAYKYRGWLDLADVRNIFKKPRVPDGNVDFSGAGTAAGGVWKGDGHYNAHDIRLPYKWFHSGGISSRGTYIIARGELNVPDFSAQALGGAMQGRVNLVFNGLRFRVESHATGMNLASVLDAVNNKNFPVDTFHWQNSMSVDAITTWTRDFKHLESRGTSDWTPPAENSQIQLAQGEIPAAAHLDYDYVMDRNSVTMNSSEITTPASRLTMSGMLGADDSALDVGFEAANLLPWDDFINALRGPSSTPVRITGQASWHGKLTGPLTGPTFAGHTRIADAAYGAMYWDEAEGEMTYSPEIFRLVRAHARRGNSSAQLELELTLDEWSFFPDAEWKFDADLTRTAIDGMQQLFGWSFPVHGLLSGSFHGRGTRENPQIGGLFDFAELNAWGWPIDRARGEFTLNHDAVSITNGEVRMMPAAAHATTGPSLLTGNFTYRFANANVNFDLTGAVIPLEDIRRIQSARLPLGGALSFQMKGSGPLLAPVTQGTIRIVDFRAGDDVLGSFGGKLDADGKQLRVELNSALPENRLKGSVELAFSGDLPIYGELDVKDFDATPLIRAGLHLSGVSGHSGMDGHLKLTGALLQPDSITVDADLTHLGLDYGIVKLGNKGDIKITYKRNEVRVEQANLQGTDTDFNISGFTRFAGDKAIAMKILGTANLGLIDGFAPGLDARGGANINTSIEGTLTLPRISGRIDVKSASATYSDFPAGLSNVTGGFVFDASRLLFQNVSAEIGGGEVILGGTLNYAEGFGAARYDINARATNVRIRYPVGMSWMSSGTLRLAGTPQAALLSGNVTVQRLLMSEGFDLASLLVTSKASPVRAPTTSSPFLRNLQFDVQANSAPDARVEWTNNTFEAEADLRVRGTWENPILLGRISLLNGELSFGGNRYRLARGDIDFTNPFRLDPVLNVQATTTIQQYEVTLDISGPASRLTLNYRSDPPLPTSDVINLLALGQATESTAYRGATSAQTPQTGATSLLSEAISNQLGGRLQKIFGITRFRVDPFLAGTTNEQNGAARVTIEEQVGQHFTVTYVTNVGGAQEEVIQVEYVVRPDLSVIALRDYNGTFSLDIVKKKRFK